MNADTTTTDGQVAAGPNNSSGAAPQLPSAADATAMPSFKARKPSALQSMLVGVVVWLLTRQSLQWLLRTLCPILRLPLGWAAVTRYDDVSEVLTRQDVFVVPFAAEIARLNDGEAPGTAFILGIDDPNQHHDQLKLVMQAFKRSDVEELVTPIARRSAQDIIAGAPDGRIDAIKQLITRVPLDLCVKYYGVGIPGDQQDFADATIAVSGHLFGPPPIQPKPASDEAAAYVRGVVDRAIDRELKNPGNADTVLARLVAMRQAGQLTPREIRAFLMGMIIGFVPTNTMAGGNILEMLLRERAFMARARAAALAGDDDLLKHCLFEALRFMPHNVGPFRICSRDYTVAADTPRATKIKKNTKVLAWTMSAMFDSRQVDAPLEFRPGRPASNSMLFGYGMHWCVGAFIAQAQITQTFKALVARPKLERAGELQRRGGFPNRLLVKFRPV
jgi:cytochrome P450